MIVVQPKDKIHLLESNSLKLYEEMNEVLRQDWDKVAFQSI